MQTKDNNPAHLYIRIDTHFLPPSSSTVSREYVNAKVVSKHLCSFLYEHTMFS